MQKPRNHSLNQIRAMPAYRVVCWGVIAAMGVLIAGCAHPSLHDVQLDQRAEMAKAKSAPSAFRWNNQGIYINHKAVTYRPGVGSVSVNVNAAPVGGALAHLVALHHYSLFFSGSASPDTRITTNISETSLIGAVRQMAQAAGYCAIIHPKARRSG